MQNSFRSGHAETFIMASTSTMFMNWKVPTRLYQKDPSLLQKTNSGNELDDHAKIVELSQKLPPAYLVRKTHDPTTTTHFTPKPGTVRQMREREIEEHVLREIYTREKNKGKEKSCEATHLPAMPLLSAKLNAKQERNRPQNVGVMPIPTNAVTMSGKIRSEITQADRNYINNAFNKRPDNDIAKAVTKWLESATPRDRELAVDFFSSLAGKKLLGGDQAKEEGTGSAGSAGCRICDGTRLKEVLNTLRSGRPVAERDQRNLRPGESNRRRLRLLSPFTRRHKQEMQSWHHLPTYAHTGPVSNTIALFTRPHRPAQRHFTIHPEWE